MAQKILLRRGPVGNISAAAVSQGELLLATGSIGDLSGPFVTMAGTAGTGTSTLLGKIYEGAAAPSVNSTLTGLPFYSTSDSALYRLNHSGNEKLDLSGNLEGTTINSITASGSFNGTFVGDGSGLTNIPADNIILSTIVDGNGIADFSYDGTSSVTISAEISGSTLSLGASGLAVAASGISTVEIADGAVTNAKLAGSIANSKLVNSSVVIGSTTVNLGDTVTSFAGVTLTGAIATGSFNGTFVGDGSALTNLNLGSLSAPGNSGEILYNNAGALDATSALTLNGTSLTVTGDISGSSLYLSGNANIDGNIVLGGNITIGDASTDTVSFGGEISSDIIPSADNTYDLGSTGDKFAEVHATALYGDLTGDVTGQVSDISNHDTDALSEGTTNLYYTDARVRAAITVNSEAPDGGGDISLATDDIPEDAGATNLYFTDARVKSKLNAEGVLSGSVQVETGGDLSGDATNVTVTAVQGVSVTSGEITQIANIGTTTISGTQWGYIGNLDQNLSTGNNVTFTDLSLDGNLSINTNKFIVNNATGNTTVAGTLGVTGAATLSSTLDVSGALTVTADIDADDITINDWGSVSASLAAIESGANALSLQDVVTVGSTSTDAITVRDLSIGGDAANEISTTSGNLVIDSAGGTVTIDDNLTVAGNLVVQGTTTTVDSTEVNIGDRILTLNAASTADDGGIQVIDTVGTAGTGSLLWNASSDYWYAGVSGSTHYRLATFTNASPSSDGIVKIDANGRLVASNISDDGSAVTVSTGLTAAGLTDSTSAAATRFSYINASKKHAYETPTAAGQILQWNGSAMEASNVIDGGSF